ncbi:multiple inositol polyphosphate phosphatase 1-like [Epargyreus clarus]|uniref:multiple inositol polyphosphate phosphatase 1-like n=1 Tax=Epargyreus clarus TaxID=520877 RepID=UPI003C2AC8E9
MKNVIGLRDYVISNYEQGESPLCAQDVENLRNWRHDSDIFEKIHGLTDEGYLEMVGIGSRLREAFRELLARIEEGSYRFRSAYGHWMEDGVSGFITGLTNETLIIEESNATYDILAPYEACPKYRHDVKRNPLTYIEVSKYESSNEYTAMKHGLERRIGVKNGLSNSNITALYDLCRYTWSGVQNKPSPWCALFSPEDLKVLEYVGDLRHYYRNGYGTPMNIIFGRIPMADLFKTFSENREGFGKKLTTYFSHATMMDMVLSALGLSKDETPLTGKYRDPKRKWKTSTLSAFGVNLMAVLNRCTVNNLTEYKVVFYFNEDLLTSICNGGICSWQEFEEKFKPFVDANIQFCFTVLDKNTKKDKVSSVCKLVHTDYFIETMKVPVLIVLIVLIGYGESLYCYWNTGCAYKFFSSKTPYNSIRGDIRDSIVNLKGCEPISIWGLIRHGKIQPNAVQGKNMQNAITIRNDVVTSYDKGHSSLCAQDVENLKNWKLDNKFLQEHQLTEEGYQEMYGIGKRIKETFPQLLNDIKDGSYTIRPAHGHWIEKSAKAFVEGLGNRRVKLENSKENDVMAPYLTCGKYQKDVQNNPDIFAEADKYISTSDYLAAKDRIQRRSGIEYDLTDVNVTALYDLCRHTLSGFDNKVSPWCALFTSDDLQVLEYIHDLRYYYKNGYGTAQNGKFGGIPLEDLLMSFQRAKEGNGKKITAYFTHATMIDMIYMSLGLFKDAPLTAANRDRDRKWRTSKISAFGVNLVAVLNRCSKNGSDDYNVVFYLNEEPMRSICEEGVCSWQEFEDKLKPFVNTTTDFCEFQSEPYK